MTEKQTARIEGIAQSVTIGRVMMALKECGFRSCFVNPGYIYSEESGEGIDWSLAKENGQESTLSDQGEETIEALYKLFVK